MVQQESWSRGELTGSDVYEEARVVVQDLLEDDDEDALTADDVEDDEEVNLYALLMCVVNELDCGYYNSLICHFIADADAR